MIRVRNGLRTIDAVDKKEKLFGGIGMIPGGWHDLSRDHIGAHYLLNSPKRPWFQRL